MERKYLVYKIVGPTGTYVGVTKQKLIQRWTCHRTRARTGYNHPFSNSIREFGSEAFIPTEIIKVDTKAEAHELEKEYIALFKSQNFSYNISPGGDFDHLTGSWIHWEKYNTDPIYRAEYSKRLVAGMINGKQHDYENLKKHAKKWRDDNVRIAWKLSWRGLRMANKANAEKFAHLEKTPKPTLKHRLLWKFKRNTMCQQQVTRIWATRDEKTKQEIFGKISTTLKDKNKHLSADEKMAMVSKARACIDRSIQGPAASAGIKKFWVDLKADPERYKAHMEAKTKKMMQTRNSI